MILLGDDLQLRRPGDGQGFSRRSAAEIPAGHPADRSPPAVYLDEANQLADLLAPLRITQILRGQRAISADTDLRRARYFGASPGIWLRLQARCNLEVAQQRSGKPIEPQVKVRQAAPSTLRWRRARVAVVICHDN